ncbi:MAG: hypothetical protein RIB78_01300 [Gammaproteobacteria bacterium]
MTTEATELSEEARVAYQAFQDMSKSKDRYFGFLQELDVKYKNGGAPGIAENLQLEKLLKEHDKNVLAFNTAMAAVEDHDARLQLIKMMS